MGTDVVHMGIDIGQVKDPTAICVAEVKMVDRGKARVRQTGPSLTSRGYQQRETSQEKVLETDYTVRHIERLSLGTSYPDVAAHIAGLLKSDLLFEKELYVYIDITGVGRPIYQMVEEACRAQKETYKVMLKPITFTGGQDYDRSTGSLGKAYMVSRMQVLLQEQLVHAPDTQEVRAMLEELRVYEIKVSDDGKDTYGAKIGKHDDLATALGLACIEAPYANRTSTYKSPWG